MSLTEPRPVRERTAPRSFPLAFPTQQLCYRGVSRFSDVRTAPSARQNPGHRRVPLSGAPDPHGGPGSRSGGEDLLAGRAQWITLLSEVLPRALLNELGLARILLGSSGGGQFLVVLPDTARAAAEEFLQNAPPPYARTQPRPRATALEFHRKSRRLDRGAQTPERRVAAPPLHALGRRRPDVFQPPPRSRQASTRTFPASSAQKLREAAIGRLVARDSGDGVPRRRESTPGI